MRKTFLLIISFFSFSFMQAQTPHEREQIENFSIFKEMEIPQYKERGLQDKIILITSKYCPTCRKMEPLIMAAIDKNHLSQYLKHFIVSNEEDKKELGDIYRLNVTFYPMLIVNGHAYIGKKEADFYDKILSEETARLKKKEPPKSNEVKKRDLR